MNDETANHRTSCDIASRPLPAGTDLRAACSSPGTSGMRHPKINNPVADCPLLRISAGWFRYRQDAALPGPVLPARFGGQRTVVAQLRWLGPDRRDAPQR